MQAWQRPLRPQRIASCFVSLTAHPKGKPSPRGRRASAHAAVHAPAPRNAQHSSAGGAARARNAPTLSWPNAYLKRATRLH